jgi:hypothetical protein
VDGHDNEDVVCPKALAVDPRLAAPVCSSVPCDHSFSVCLFVAVCGVWLCGGGAVCVG